MVLLVGVALSGYAWSWGVLAVLLIISQIVYLCINTISYAIAIIKVVGSC